MVWDWHGWSLFCCFFVLCVCMCIRRVPVVSFWGSPSPQFGIFDRGHWQVCLSNLSNGIRTNIKGFVSRKVFWILLWNIGCIAPLWSWNLKISCTKKAQIMKKNGKTGYCWNDKHLCLIKYTGASVVTGVYGERYASVVMQPGNPYKKVGRLLKE